MRITLTAPQPALGSSVAPPAPRLAAPSALSAPVPGVERPPVAPKHPALPNPVPGLQQLAAIAAAAPREYSFTPGAHPSTIRNAHYTNTRAQLAYALAGPYNSVEGDVRVENGIPVMKHDGHAAADLTFEQWAWLANKAGKHLRVDVKEAAGIPAIAETLERLGIPGGSITFNVGAGAPWASNNMSVPAIRALRQRFPESWVTLNLAVPLLPGYKLAVEAAKRIGGDRLGVAVMAETVRESDVRLLRTVFASVNAWNLPLLGEIDVEAATKRLRAIGVNGMMDLRIKSDPLADD